jgi:dihydropteroate synthase
MGIVNLTPDSFSDGGRYGTVEAALGKATEMVNEGAAILDVGGESTRPGATPVSPDEEVERILPFFEAASDRIDVPLSVDTRRASVARAALDAGAEIVNDISALAHDPAMAATVASSGRAVVLMHMRGTPVTMGRLARYHDVVGEVVQELEAALARASTAGIGRDRIAVDPGIGFAKDGAHNLALLRDLGSLGRLGRPLLVGPSRKRFIGEITGREPRERVHGTAAACVMAYLEGARIFRVHDVGPVVQALAVARAIVEEDNDGPPDSASGGAGGPGVEAGPERNPGAANDSSLDNRPGGRIERTE